MRNIEQVDFGADIISKSILIFFVFDITLGLLFIADNSLNHDFWKLHQTLNLEFENNLPTWYASVKYFLIALIFGLFAVINSLKSKKSSWVLWIFPILFLILSLDEIGEFHEWFGYQLDRFLPDGDRKNTPFHYTGIWTFVVSIPFVTFSFWIAFQLKKFIGDKKSIKIFLYGVFFLVAGANGIETLANFVGLRTWQHVMQVFFEETFEMIGATFFLWAAMETLTVNSISLRYMPVIAKGPVMKSKD